MADTYGFNSADSKRIANTVRKVERLNGIGLQTDSNAPLPQLFIKLVEQDGTDPLKWSWQQIIRKHDGTYEDGPLSGDLTNNPAFNLEPTMVLDVDDRAVAFRMPERQTDGSIKLVWCFQDTVLPLAQYQYMMFQMTSQNQTGYNFCLAHSFTP